jgi:C1A family cysteine protease
MARTVKRYGWQRDLPDHRDRIFNLEEPVRLAHQLPVQVDLQAEMPPVYDQGELGSCTAHAVSVILEHRQLAQGELKVNPSRLFLYYEERRVGGYPIDQDTGAQVRDGIKVAASEGVPHEPDWPYDVSRFAQQPPPIAYSDAVQFEAVTYKRIVIGPGAPMRTALANRQPIAFGFSVPSLFESPAWNPATDFLPLPSLDDQFVGGHAVTIVGYDYTRKRFPVPVFKVRNSWGEQWGAGGYFFMDARWFDPYRGLADDLWVVTKVK